MKIYKKYLEYSSERLARVVADREEFLEMERNRAILVAMAEALKVRPIPTTFTVESEVIDPIDPPTDEVLNSRLLKDLYEEAYRNRKVYIRARIQVKY